MSRIQSVLAAGGVVGVGQPKVVGVFVGKDAQSAVLRLDRVVANPDIRVADLEPAEQRTVGRTNHSNETEERVPAIAPDGVLALEAASGLLADSGMDRLHVVDVPIGFVEVAVAIPVIAIPNIELLDIGGDLVGVMPAANCSAYQASAESTRKSQTVSQTLLRQSLLP